MCCVSEALATKNCAASASVWNRTAWVYDCVLMCVEGVGGGGGGGVWGWVGVGVGGGSCILSHRMKLSLGCEALPVPHAAGEALLCARRQRCLRASCMQMHPHSAVQPTHTVPSALSPPPPTHTYLDHQQHHHRLPSHSKRTAPASCPLHQRMRKFAVPLAPLHAPRPPAAPPPGCREWSSLARHSQSACPGWEG